MSAVATSPDADLASITDFNEFLHALRSRELQRLPAGARTVVHGGCAGEWYFDWFAEYYPGEPERHYGIELFSPPPKRLPADVTWLPQSLANMAGVVDGEADLVFAGEVIEHLWPDDVAGFLAEAWRVLRPGGVVALDSPNRVIAEALVWTHPEHTLELSTAEIASLLRIAGFEDVALRGVWLCYDRDAHELLDLVELDGQSLTRAQRVELAEERPEDAFVWWAQATRGPSPPDVAALRRKLESLYGLYRPGRLGRMQRGAPRERWDRALGRVASMRAGESGVVVHGPYAPVAAGEWEAVLRVARRDAGAIDPRAAVGEVDVAAMSEPLATRELRAGDLADDGSLTEVALAFRCDTTRMGVEVRLVSNGTAALEAPLQCALRRRERAVSAPAPAPSPPAGPPAQTPSKLTWPIRRILDPRLRLVHEHIERTEQRLIAHLEPLAARDGQALAPGLPRSRPAHSPLGYNKLCELEDFSDPDLAALMRDVFPAQLERYGPAFPAGREYRKYWEVAMAARAFRDFGALHASAEILGVGAGAENTMHWLTRHVRAVHATDTYLHDDDWNRYANAQLMLDPEATFAGEWNPRRLVVQHMDGRALRYEDGSFDGVFSSSSIEHFGDAGDVRRSLEEICRVLRPGAIAAISTEYRLAGPPPGLPNVLMFDAAQLRELVAGLPWELVSPLSTEISQATIDTAIPFATAAADFAAGRDWSDWPHIVLREGDLEWTSVHLTLRKLG